MRVTRFRYIKNKLMKLPSDERTLLLALGHAYDEISALGKMLFWSAGSPGMSDAEVNARYALMFLFIRLLAGKLFETWEIFRKVFFARKLSKVYEPELDKEATEALEKLKRYFSNKNSVSEIRNNYAFHYSPDDIDTVLPNVKEPLYFYLSGNELANNLYYSSELLAAYALLDAIGEKEIDEGFSKLVDELFDISLCFMNSIDAIMAIIFSKFGKERVAEADGFVDFDSLNDMQKFHIPWFTFLVPFIDEESNSP